MGKEGAAARCYFAAVPRVLRPRGAEPLLFQGRSRRPPRDPINALMGLGYGMLTAELVGALGGMGLDPRIGVFHSSRGRMPALAQDLLELFRAPVADGLAFSLANLGIFGREDFRSDDDGGVYLTREALPRYLREYRRRMNAVVRSRVGARSTLRRELQAECARFRRAILGQEEYRPLVLPAGGPDRGAASANLPESGR